jgi:protein SCO1/2
MSTMTDVKRLLGSDGERLQVIFITLDPERDTAMLLKSYMQSFDASFLALRPTETELKSVTTEFKIYHKQVPGSTPSTYTVDHSAGKFVYDAQGRIRLFSAYGTAPVVIAADIKILMNERSL